MLFAGFSLECTFGDGNTCSYEDVSEHSLWHVQDNFTFSDEDGVQQTITPEGNLRKRAFPTLYNTIPYYNRLKDKAFLRGVLQK